MDEQISDLQLMHETISELKRESLAPESVFTLGEAALTRVDPSEAPGQESKYLNNDEAVLFLWHSLNPDGMKEEAMCVALEVNLK